MRSIIILGLFHFTSCSSLYVANHQSVTMVREKNDISGSYNKGFAGEEIQLAYSPYQNIGIQLNGLSTYTNLSDFSDLNDVKAWEIGLGYYNNDTNWHFENYVLFAKVNMKKEKKYIYIPTNTNKFSTDFNRYALQTAFSYRYKFIEAIISNRFSVLNYYNARGDYTTEANYLQQNPIHSLIEPAITLRLGLKNVMLQYQMQSSYNISSSMKFKHDSRLTSAGILIRI